MSFANDLNRFTERLERQRRDIFVGVAVAVHDSVVEGSPVTGAPGQPVDTETLKESWTLSFPSATLARVITNVEYAEPVEEGIGPYGPMQLRSEVGGWHSVKLTRAGYQHLVDQVVREAVYDPIVGGAASFEDLQ